MRILHIIATLDERAGGPSNSVRRLLATYPSIGAYGEALTLDAPTAPFLQHPDIKKLTIHPLGPALGNGRVARYAFTPRLLPWLRTNLPHYDGVVLHGLWQYPGIALRIATINKKKPYAVFSHGMLDPWFRHAYPLKHLKKSTYWFLTESHLLRRARFVLFTSQAESRLARQSFPLSRWTPRIVPYGATAPTTDPAALISTFLTAHPTLANPDGTPKPFLLFLGRLHPKKGCDLLLEAFAQVFPQSETTSAHLHLVFAGPDPDSLTHQLRTRAETLGLTSRVHFTGMLEGPQKWGALHAAKVFALPSHQENFGIAVAESLACATPVLISDKVNIHEEILTARAGLTAPDTLPGTIDLLTRWHSLTPPVRLQMSINARTCFLTRYDMRANAQSILEIFTELSNP